MRKQKKDTVIEVDYDDIILDEELESKKNSFFQRFSKTDPKDLHFDSIQKMNTGPIKKIWRQVLSLWKIVKSDRVSLQQKAMAVGALVYLVSPIDAIPDAIVGLGLTDDVAVITYVVSQLASVIKDMNKKEIE